jgi:hypothetical protein
MEAQKKLVNCIGRNGSALSIRAENIVFAQPDEQFIGETMIVINLGAAQAQLFVKMPHAQFVRLWEAAINGRETVQAVN